MTENPFQSRISAAAREGYVNGPARDRVAVLDGPAPRTAFRARLAAPRPASPQRDAGPVTCSGYAAQYAIDLLTQRRIEDEARPAWRNRLAVLREDQAAVRALSPDQCSALIDCLKALPVRAAAVVRPEVPEGRYAVEWDGTLWFVKVDRPTEGRWAGYTFIERQLGGDYQRLNRKVQASLLRMIGEDARAAAVRYGKELGHCGSCGRELTNAESRAAGIGPVCRAKNGW